MAMMTLAPTPVCPHCGSLKLRFLEHGAVGTVFQCESCAQATVQRWESTPATVAKRQADLKALSPDSHAKVAGR
jgi:hypothetical protein